jgi:hypothetical protein
MCAKRFKTTGPCNPERNYMVDTRSMIAEITTRFIDPGEYFVVNRARQYGKTTTMQLLEGILSERYLVLQTSFEASEDIFVSRGILAEEFSFRLSRTIRERDPGYAGIADMLALPMSSNDRLSELATRISALCKQAGKPVILMIDEIDRAADFDVFASLLFKLRSLYQRRDVVGWDSTFHSVILAGVHNIKYLKTKIRHEPEHTLNSPWNITVTFDVDMSFSPAGISTMLDAYEQDHATGMDTGKVADRIFQYTGGYPFLVSLTCRLMDEKGLSWTEAGVDEAARLVMKEDNTLFDDFINNLQDHH